MTPQSKRKNVPESPQKTSNKKSKQTEASAPLEDAPRDGSSAWPPLPYPSGDPDDDANRNIAWFRAVFQSLRNECITKSPYFKRAPDLPVVRPGVGSRMRERMDKYDAEHPDAFQQLFDQLNNIDENKLPPPLSPRAVDARLRRMGINIAEDVTIPDVDGLIVTLLSDTNLAECFRRVSRLERGPAEFKESLGREKQALFDRLVEATLAKERATHANNQLGGK